MDIKRTILWAIFVISSLMLIDSWQRYQGHASWFSPAPVKQVQPQQANSGSNQDLPKVASSATPNAVAPSTAHQVNRTGQLINLKNDVISLEIDSLGGSVVQAQLLEHLDEQKAPLVLFTRTNAHQYFARSGLVSASGVELPNHTQIYSVTKSADGLTVTLSLDKNGIRLDKVFKLEPGSYLVEVQHHIKNMGAQSADVTLYNELVRDGTKLNESSFYSTFTGPAVYTDADKFRKFEFSEIDKAKVSLPTTQSSGQNVWVSMIQHYFTSAWIPSAKGAKDFYADKLENNLYRVGVKSKLDTIAAGQQTTETTRLYVGPQHEKVLETIAPGLELVKDYGWLTILAKPIFWLLEKIHGLVMNWGWAIIILTILIKLAFFPLSAASYKSMARMKEVQPKLLEMKERYKGEPQKLNQAMMEMYKKEKINPLGGCFPILIQIPVFIALYWVLLSSIEMRGAPWLGWITDLAKPDPFFILPIIMAVSMFIQTKLNPTPPDPMQAKVMLFMPIVFSVMFFFFPAGLVLYWVVNNILSIAQQWQINKIYGGAKTA